VNIKDISNHTYTYTATNVVLQPGKTFEVPIILSFPNCKVNFEFATDPEVIKFGICFVAALEEGQTRDDIEVEMIEEMENVACSLTAPVVGSFDCKCEGVVFFMFENESSWEGGGSSRKELTYLIEVHQPSFTTIDEERCFRAQGDIKIALDELESSSICLADAEVLVERTTEEVIFLQEQLEALAMKLEAKYLEYEENENELDSSLQVLSSGYSRINGLCIRMLDKKLLSKLVSFTDFDGPTSLVCKYWNRLAQANQVPHVGGAEGVVRTRGAASIYLTPAEKAELLMKQMADKNEEGTESNVDKEVIASSLPKDSSGLEEGPVNMFMTTPMKIQQTILPNENFMPVQKTSQIDNEEKESDVRQTETQVPSSKETTKEKRERERAKKSADVKEMAPESKDTVGSERREKYASRSKDLLKDIKSIRSEKQLNDMLEYIAAGYEKIESLANEKRRIKKIQNLECQFFQA